jgi:DNA polymerase-3 subunit gamma/tau
MSYLVLARKYRPQTFAEIVEQEHVTRTLANAITSGRVAHAILFAGPRGTGKTTVARILAKALNCTSGPAPTPCNQCRSCEEITAGRSVDVYEIDGASNNSVDQIRELRANVKYMPAHSRYKIYIIDEVHMLSNPAFNALLKTLEEPPEHVVFLFATTEVHKIPVTILSRCQRYDFRRIRLESIAGYLATVCRREGVEIGAQSLELIARESGGSIRDGLSLLDQVIACGPDGMSPGLIADVLGVIDRKQLHDLADAVLARDVERFLGTLDDVFERGHDMKKLFAELLDHVRNLLVVAASPAPQTLLDLPPHEIDLLRAQAAKTTPATVHQILDAFFREEAAVRLSPQPKLALEMAFFRILSIPPALSIDTLITQIEALRREIGRVPPPAGPGTEPPVSAGSPSRPAQSAAARERSPDRSAPAADSSAGMPAAAPGLEEAWEKILEITRRDHPSLAAQLKHCCLKRADAVRVEIVAPDSRFSAGMLRRDKNVAILKRVCSELMGPSVELVVEAGQECTPDLRQKRARKQELLQHALNHPLVSDALEVFNGKLIDVQVIQEVDK